MARRRKALSAGRVLLLGPDRTAVSGVATHLNQLFGSALASEFELDWFQIGSEGRSEGKFAKAMRLAGSPFGLVGELVQGGHGLVHLNTSLDRKAFWRDMVYLMVAKMLGRKTVYQVHGGDLPLEFAGGARPVGALVKWVLRRPDAVVLLADVELQAYRAIEHIKRLTVIPNAIDLGDFADAVPKAYTNARLRFGYIGRLAADKGIAEAIDACGSLLAAGKSNFEFRVAGSGPAEASLRAQAATVAPDHIHFVGPLSGRMKVGFWLETDVFVFPTHGEGLPYTVLESLASGTPMVTTPVGAIPDVVRDSEHGRFVSVGDVPGVARILSDLLEDRDWLRKASHQCLQRARAEYGVDRLARQFSSLYRSVLD